MPGFASVRPSLIPPAVVSSLIFAVRDDDDDDDVKLSRVQDRTSLTLDDDAHDNDVASDDMERFKSSCNAMRPIHHKTRKGSVLFLLLIVVIMAPVDIDDVVVAVVAAITLPQKRRHHEVVDFGPQGGRCPSSQICTPTTEENDAGLECGAVISSSPVISSQNIWGLRLTQ